MARKETIIIVDFNVEPVEQGAADTTVAIAGVSAAATKLADKIDQAFAGAKVDMNAFCREMFNGLLSLRLNLGKLKKALEEAVAPVAAVVLPVINEAVRALTGFVSDMGLVLGVLVSGSQGNEDLAQSAQNAAQAENNLATAVKRAGTAAKRSLAGFDRINRLNGSSGGSSVIESTVTEPLKAVSPQLLKAVGKLRSLLEPLEKIDLEPLRKTLGRLGQTLGELGDSIGPKLETLWSEVLVPLGGWVIREAAPETVGLLTKALQLLRQALDPVLEGLQKMLPYLEPIIGFISETATQTLGKLGTQLEKLGLAFSQQSGNICQAFEGIGQIVGKVWELVSPILDALRNDWLEIMDVVDSVLATCAANMIHVLSGLVNFVAGIFTGNWSRAWKGLKDVVRGAINGVIGMLNGLLRAMTLAINGVVRAINGISFQLPNWDLLGDLAGQSFGLNIPTVTAPQIPYLAQGAVLPANRPFLAMVGDQRHGTNIEAPLSTIQEAVALVMEDLSASNLAGQEAILGALRQILEAVLDISIGDDVIGSAAERYQQKMTIVRGGYL